jgi:hypothetical protein
MAMRKVHLLSIVLFITLALIVRIAIMPDSLEKAIDKQGWNHPFLTVELDHDSALLFIEEEKGQIRLASAYHGFWGWKIVEDSGLLSVNEDAIGFSGGEEKINLRKNKELHYLLGIIVDENIDSMTYREDNEQKETTISTFTTNQGTRIYYATSEEELGEITINAYNHENEVVYSKP